MIHLILLFVEIKIGNGIYAQEKYDSHDWKWKMFSSHVNNYIFLLMMINPNDFILGYSRNSMIFVDPDI